MSSRDGRAVPPDETLARVLRFRARMGLTRVANITGLDTLGIPVWTACRPNSRSLSVSQGKGVDHRSARISAVMESVEAYHAERVDQPLRLASYAEIADRLLVADVVGLPRTRKLFHPDLPLLWIEAREIASGAGVWVPFELVHLNYTKPVLPGAGLFLATSNGLASGNTKAEALSHALSEVIERDASALWTLAGGVRSVETRVDPVTIDHPVVVELLERCERARVAVAIWDMTSDVGIPCFTCVVGDRETSSGRRYSTARGMGCHPDAGVALLRALTEAAQSRLTVISGSRDDLAPSRYQVAEYQGDAGYLRAILCEGRVTRDFRATRSVGGGSADDDVQAQAAALRAVGLDQILVVDLTMAEFGIPVVRAVVPGLEGPEYAPGYLPGKRALKRLEGAAK